MCYCNVVQAESANSHSGIYYMMRSNAMSQPLLNVQNGQNKPNMVGVTRFEPTDRICAGRAKCMKDFVYTHFTVLHSCYMQYIVSTVVLHRVLFGFQALSFFSLVILK